MSSRTLRIEKNPWKVLKHLMKKQNLEDLIVVDILKARDVEENRK